MTGARARRALLALAVVSAPAAARDIEVTRSCFPSFCVESAAAFVPLLRDEARGRYRLRLSRAQATVYLDAGPAPAFPRCEGTCVVEGDRARHFHSRRVVEKLFGPFEPCAGGPPLYVHAWVVFGTESPEILSVERACETLTPPRSGLSPRG